MDFQKVYIVLGIAQSICSAIRQQIIKSNQSYSLLVGQKLRLTLLPYDNRIVYDGLMTVMEPMSHQQLKRSFKAYVNAFNTKTLIHRIELIEPKVESHQEIKLSGTELLQVKSIAQDIKSLPYISTKPITTNNPIGESWIFRRHGYSEQENPEHAVTVMQSSGMPLVMYHQLNQLVPTAMEILSILQTCIDMVGNKKPNTIFVDEESLVEPLDEVLSKMAGIKVSYYPPPSQEEAQAARHYDSKVVNACYVCGSTRKLLQCGSCKSIFYCSREHQKLDWKRHKPSCHSF